jgi:hypothetical protein
MNLSLQSREYSTPNPVVAGSQRTRSVCKLRSPEKLLFQSLYEVCRQAAESNARAPKRLEPPISKRLILLSQWAIAGIMGEDGSAQLPQGASDKNRYYVKYEQSEPLPSSATLLILDLLIARGNAITPADFLVWELILLHATRQDWAERILVSLFAAESKESDVWRQDDLRVSWLCVLFAARGYANPWNQAFLSFYGKPLSSALAYWAERDRLNQKELDDATRQVQLLAFSKKPASPERGARCTCGSLLLRHYKFCAECGKGRAA